MVAQRRRVPLLALLVLGLAAGACREEELRFDHRTHLARRVACESCHDLGAATLRAGHRACSPCHPIGERPGKSCRRCHARAAGEKPAASLVRGPAASAGDLVFSHSRHRGRGIPCARCHEGIEGSRRVEPGAYLPAMESCVECHRGLGATATRCSVCHEHISAAARPASHDLQWLSRHGAESHAEGALCTACHAGAECVRCHQETPPRDHTEFWLRRGHGLKSRWDRERCLACHREDACVECHRTTPPTSHGPGWAEPTFRHCRRCHYPVSDTECAVCHSRAHPRGVPFHP